MLSNRWFILSIIFLARISMGYQFQSIGSVSPSLIKEFAIEYAAIGTLIGLQSLPGLFLSLPSGILGNRFGDKRIALWGLMLMTVGTIMVGLSHSFTMAATGRLISGIGTVLMNVMMFKMVADWFAGKEIITAMAIYVNSYPAGIGLGLATQPSICSVLNWSAVFHISAATSALGLGLMAVFYYSPAETQRVTTGPTPKVQLTGREIYLVTLAAIIWAFFNTAFIIVPTFGPPLLSSKGMVFAEAAVLVSFNNWFIIGSIPLGGWMAQKLLRPSAFLALGCIIFGALLVLFPYSSALPMIIALGIIGGIPAGSIIALPATVLSPRSRSIGMGLFYSLYYGIMTVMPALAGLVLDLTKSTASPFFLGAGLLFISIIILIWFRSIQKPIRMKREQNQISRSLL